MEGRRNLIILLAHGLRADAVSGSRAWPLATDHLEGLGRRGIRAIAGAASPGDPGAMTSLLTGLHARQHGRLADPVPDAENGSTAELRDSFVHALAGAGYHVAGVGCVRPIRSALHEAVLAEDVSVLRSDDCAYYRAARSNGTMAALMAQRQQRLRTGPFEPDRLMLQPEDDIDGFISAEAARLLRRMPNDRPWALVVVFSGPGNDLPPPTLYDGIVPRSHLRTGFAPVDMRDLDAVAEPAYPRAILQRLEPARLAQIRSDYLGRVSLIDFAVRRLNRDLEGREDAGRTWTLLASDRGHLLGEHGLVGHRSFLAGAVETPVLLAPPAGSRPENTRVPQGLHSTVDIAATVTALAGCDRPAGCSGRSLLPLLEHDAVTPPLPGGILSEMNDRLMLETQRYKLVLQRSTGQPLALFDMLNDPDEQHNLATSPTARNILDPLKSRLADALLPLQRALA